MINLPIDKILFIDIETVGMKRNFEELSKDNPKMASLFEHYESWFKKRFPEDSELTISELFLSKSALVAEFSKIVCVCMGITDPKGNFKTTVITNDNEKELLESVRKTLTK
jgi:hypothetical protein